MKNLKKKVVLIATLTCMMVSLASGSQSMMIVETNAAEAERPTTGKCGRNVKYSFDDETGTLR